MQHEKWQVSLEEKLKSKGFDDVTIMRLMIYAHNIRYYLALEKLDPRFTEQVKFYSRQYVELHRDESEKLKLAKEVK